MLGDICTRGDNRQALLQSSANALVACQFMGWSPTSPWDGRPIFGLVARQFLRFSACKFTTASVAPRAPNPPDACAGVTAHQRYSSSRRVATEAADSFHLLHLPQLCIGESAVGPRVEAIQHWCKARQMRWSPASSWDGSPPVLGTVAQFSGWSPADSQDGRPAAPPASAWYGRQPVFGLG